MLHVSGLRFVNALGVVGEDPFNLTFSDYRWRTRANFGNWDWWGANADSDPWRGGWGRREGVTRNEVHGACGGTCRLAWSPRGATIPHHASREPISLQVPTLILPMVRLTQSSGCSDGKRQRDPFTALTNGRLRTEGHVWGGRLWFGRGWGLGQSLCIPKTCVFS